MSSTMPSDDPTDSHEADPRPGGRLRFRYPVSVAISALAYAGVYWVCGKFEHLYRSFGVELPWLSRAVIGNYQFSAVLLLIGLVPCAILLTKRDLSLETRVRLGKLIMLGVYVASGTILLALFATYLPMSLASSVG
ncbi:MAG: hypothetical protein JJU27_12035 [Gammaproteobacteria bacterium]|nr:hypothetical protein [Gammaproteobacteria bacterium]